jgi:hypothetical protein
MTSCKDTDLKVEFSSFTKLGSHKLNRLSSSAKKIAQLAIVDADVALEWLRLAAIRQTNRNTNWLQDRLFSASIWLDGERKNQKVLDS